MNSPRLAKRHITLKLTDDARDLLAEMGYDPPFGARPLKRVIQKEVENRIAHGILDGTSHQIHSSSGFANWRSASTEGTK